LVVWPSVFERYWRVVLGSRMLGVSGRVQRQGEVIHLVTERLDDLSGLLASVGSGDRPDHKPRDIDTRDLHLAPASRGRPETSGEATAARVPPALSKATLMRPAHGRDPRHARCWIITDMPGRRPQMDG